MPKKHLTTLDLCRRTWFQENSWFLWATAKICGSSQKLVWPWTSVRSGFYGFANWRQGRRKVKLGCSWRNITWGYVCQCTHPVSDDSVLTFGTGNLSNHIIHLETYMWTTYTNCHLHKFSAKWVVRYSGFLSEVEQSAGIQSKQLTKYSKNRVSYPLLPCAVNIILESSLEVSIS